MISVIVPVFNGEGYLADCLQSLLDQTFRDFEVLVVDDGSRDATNAIARKFAERDSRVRLLTKANGGSGSARNLGLSQARGAYVAFVDGDDLVHPQYLELLLAGMEETGADIVQCAYRKTHHREPAFEKQTLRLSREYTCWEYMERFCTRQHHVESVVLWNKLYKRALFQGLAFPEGRGVDDEYLFCPLVSRAEKITRIGNPLYCYYQSRDSQMRGRPDIRIADRVEAVEGQMAFFLSRGRRDLHNRLIYRLCAFAGEACRVIRRDYPEEKQLLQTLSKKKGRWVTAMLAPQIPLRDKGSLLLRLFFPGIWEWNNKSRC